MGSSSWVSAGPSCTGARDEEQVLAGMAEVAFRGAQGVLLQVDDRAGGLRLGRLRRPREERAEDGASRGGAVRGVVLEGGGVLEVADEALRAGVRGGVLDRDLEALHGRAETLARAPAEHQGGDVAVQGEVDDEDLLVRSRASRLARGLERHEGLPDAAAVVAERDGMRRRHIARVTERGRISESRRGRGRARSRARKAERGEATRARAPGGVCGDARRRRPKRGVPSSARGGAGNIGVVVRHVASSASERNGARRGAVFPSRRARRTDLAAPGRASPSRTHSARGAARRALAARRSGQGALAPLAGVTLVARARASGSSRGCVVVRASCPYEFVRRSRRPAPPSLAGSSLAIPAP